MKTKTEKLYEAADRARTAVSNMTPEERRKIERLAKLKIPYGWKLRTDGWKDIGDLFLNSAKRNEWLPVTVSGQNHGIVVITKETK